MARHLCHVVGSRTIFFAPCDWCTISFPFSLSLIHSVRPPRLLADIGLTSYSTNLRSLFLFRCLLSVRLFVRFFVRFVCLFCLLICLFVFSSLLPCSFILLFCWVCLCASIFLYGDYVPPRFDIVFLVGPRHRPVS